MLVVLSVGVLLLISIFGWMQNLYKIMMFYITVKHYEVHIETWAQTKLTRP